MVATVYVLLFSTFYQLTSFERVLLCVVICLVIITELLNTAIEAVVNLLSPQYSKYAKIAKDTAAAAVLMSAVLAFLAGLWMFWDIPVFIQILRYFSTHLMALLLLLFSLGGSVLFILADNRENS